METTTELTTIVKIDPKEYGLEESKARDIEAQFKPMLARMVELEKEYNEIVNLPVGDAQTMLRAKELRLKYVKVRTGTAEIHKAQKSFYLAGGRFVDGWKNAQLFASEGIEKKLESIEKYAEIKEAERVAALQSERELLLAPYNIENVSSLMLGQMSEQIWDNFLAGTKANHQIKIDAEAKADADRIAAEKARAEEQERIRIENAKLKAEADAREKKFAAERKKAEAKEKAEREASEKKLREERAKAEAEAAKIKAEQDAKIKLEREAKEKAEAELKAKQVAEENAIREAEEKEQALLSAGDREKLNLLVADLAQLKSKYAFKSKKHKLVYDTTNGLIDKIITYINSKS